MEEDLCLFFEFLRILGGEVIDLDGERLYTIYGNRRKPTGLYIEALHFTVERSFWVLNEIAVKVQRVV